MRILIKPILIGICLVSAVMLTSILFSMAKTEVDSPLGFEGAFLDVPYLIRGVAMDVPVAIFNSGREPARLVGSLDYCGGACYSVRGLPMDIPAGGKKTIMLHIEPRAVGELEEEVTFYSDRPTQPTLILRVLGTIGEPIQDDNAKQLGGD